jgi:hypothetical protein
MHVNAKLRTVEAIPGNRGGEIKKSSRGENSRMMYLIHCKNLCKCYSVPPSSTTTKGKKTFGCSNLAEG